MKKFLKRLIWIILILLMAFIAAAIIIPIAFKPQLMQIAKTEINKNVNAKVEFADFQVSLIKGFPNLYVGLKDVSVVGIDSFAADTLVAFREFSVKVNLWSVMDMQNIEVKSILLDQARLKARITREGLVNWDIAKPSQPAPETEVADTSAEAESAPVNTRVALTKFEIRNANIEYIDDSSNMSASINGFNLLLSGNMGMSQTDLKIKTSIDAINFKMGGLRYVKDANFEFNAIIGANLDSSIFTFRENEFRINQIALLFDGVVKMPGNDIAVDVSFRTPSTEFKSILSMIPAIYMKDFEGLKTSGRFSIDGFVRGTYNDSIMPNASLALVVENGMFQYPDLPKSVSNVNINTKVRFDGTNMDNTTVSVDKFHLELGGNPFDARLHVATPMSDMQVDGNVTGKIDFASLADVVPLDSMTIVGVLDANLGFGGKLSYIEQEDYEKFKADGSLRLSNFIFTSNDLPQGLKINEILLNFSPKFVDLAKFDSQIGKSDLKMTGHLENFIPFVFKDQTIRGNLNVTSNTLDVNEFMTGEESSPEVEQPEEADTTATAMGVVEIPRNIKFNMKLNMEQILFDKLEISKLNGDVTVNDGIADMKNLGMNLLRGSMSLSGLYNSQDAKAPRADLNFSMKNIDIPSAFRSFSSLQKIAPAVKNMTGNVSTQLKVSTTLDTTMMPVLNSIDAYGRIQSKEIGFSNSEVFAKLADALKSEKFRNPSIRDVDVSVKIKDGVLTIDPFDTKIADAKMNFGGDMGLDQTLNFKAAVSVPASYLGPASDMLNKLAGKANLKPVDELKLNLKIVGTTSKPDVQIDWGEASSGAKESVKEMVDQKVDEAKVEARKKAKAEADKLIADAEKESVKLKEEAAKLADKIRKEAEEQAQKTEAEGKKKGPIAEKVAKEAAKEIRRKGEASAQKLIQEADAKAAQLIERAKVEAAKLDQQ